MGEGDAQLFQRHVDPYNQQDEDENDTHRQMTACDIRPLDQQIADGCNKGQESSADDPCDNCPESYSLEN